MSGFRSALSLLTVLPARGRHSPPLGDLGRSAGWFPLIGLLLGGILVCLWHLTRWFFPPPLTAALLVAAWAALSGGLHLDGLADCCDALLSPATPERRLQILQDPRLGAFGAIGLLCFLLIKVTAVLALASPAPLLLAPVLGRLAILLVAVRTPARRHGMAWEFHDGLRASGLLAATLCAAVVAGAFSYRGLLSFALVVVMAGCLGQFAVRRIGGVTGDVYGLGCELGELMVLLVGASSLG